MNAPQINLDALKFNDQGLIPAITQQFDTGEVLMMAWMNRDSLQETLRTGVACYWSRSRQKFWKKGETSGHIQKVRSIRTDCDQDTLLIQVDQVGVACHTGRRSCFYLEASADKWQVISAPEVDPETIYNSK
ncbi:MAG: phosphoribosyl-AMP cyclohydrolase [Magnetococcales bacterium]|nr:phosphoribosyl-AMP cyclohydrolase [Magnetococcales bacterium]